MKKTLLFFCLTIPILFFSCSKKEVTKNNTFNINVNQGIETLEPVMSNSVQVIWALSNLMEGLVGFDKESNLIPCIAKSWTISDNALTYTFILSDDVFFQDNECFKPDGKGRKVTAADFKYCIERACNPKAKSRGQWVYRDRIKGAQDYIDFMSGKSSAEANDIPGIRAVNDSTLIIELTKPFAPFLSILTMSYGYVYPKD
ncbi:MAG: hypothetical protein IPL53_03600 [Ignavibacteria bacterium]|nr:hypothetical protein [Ignavibacteria bacterium]